MSSEQRSNSAVRNLRSLFENKSSDTANDTRGRSPVGTLSPDAQEPPRPRSRVRASFFPVEPTMAALAAEQQNNPATEHKRESSVGLRRASMSEGHSGDALELIRDTVGTEAERRDRTSSVADLIPEQAIETPALEDNSKALGMISTEPENPDKPVTGEQEEPADMKPADPASEDAVSGGEALPPVAEDLRKDVQPASSNTGANKPSAISTKAPRASMSSVKSPKTPLSSASSARAPAKKPSRTSLTAATAASVARAAAADKQASPAAAPKPKPREATKPLDISSRLTAPTAASRARLESATNAAKAPAPARAQPKPASARPTPRSSIAGRPESRSSQNATKKAAAPVDGSFLERMTRPTAASAGRVQEKTEVKSPPRQKQLPLRPKANGHPKGGKTTSKAVADQADETVVEDESILPQEEDIPAAPADDAAADVKDTLNDSHAEPAAVLEAARKDLAEGNETPVHTNGHHEDAPASEDTPAAIGGEDSIR
ncbi:hypothetical protein M409DRAFT_30037 [Zasmidium cellare ATCC 36951]|uniref:Uncharacterized protein n=1 Tax=Zasmidium cellare ATCC 36951 TaxID=1080233 RepID=A0A6A6C161_ZASCE|nr:uncharacterized protein M409DRAFT_30037 [Zasmidium cellare ATCC 36951]KAF2159562.1 hypothetical protein M409DRAFT_30037 [Zasmidium cellare ATCC 36951]